MVKFSKYAVAAAVVAGGLTVGSLGANAMPALDTHPATAVTNHIEQTRWVCGPFRCFWRPNYYGYGGWHRPWGWRGGYGGWHRGWGGGWHGGWHRHW